MPKPEHEFFPVTIVGWTPAPGRRDDGTMWHGPWRSDAGCTTFDVRYYSRGQR